MNIETKRLILRAVEPTDARFLAEMINDPEVRDALGAYNLVFPLSEEMEQKWLLHVSKKEDEAHLIICLRDVLTPVGLLSVKDISQRNRSAHLSIILEKRSWDKGYGTESVQGTLDFLFNSMNMHRVWLRVNEANTRAIRCYEKCGFRKDGTLREDHYAHGQWTNSFIMSVLAADFRSGKR